MISKHRRRAKAIAAAAMGLTAVGIVAGCSDSSRSASTETASSSTARTSTASPAMSDAGHSAHQRAGHDSSGMAMGHTMGQEGLKALKTLQGKAFDIAFLSQMIAHHEAAVMMAKQALETAAKPETRQEARKVISAQSKEITQMTEWLKRWYDVAPSKKQQALVNGDMKGMMEMPVTTDRMFFEMMIPHHQGAIDMSALAATRSERPEVKELSEQIIRDQKAEIASYKSRMGSGS